MCGEGQNPHTHFWVKPQVSSSVKKMWRGYDFTRISHWLFSYLWFVQNYSNPFSTWKLGRSNESNLNNYFWSVYFFKIRINRIICLLLKLLANFCIQWLDAPIFIQGQFLMQNYICSINYILVKVRVIQKFPWTKGQGHSLW